MAQASSGGLPKHGAKAPGSGGSQGRARSKAGSSAPEAVASGERRSRSKAGVPKVEAMASTKTGAVAPVGGLTLIPHALARLLEHPRPEDLQ